MKLLFLSLLLAIVGCNGKEKQKKAETRINKKEMIQNSLDIQTIKSFIEQQENIETEENEPMKPYNLSEKDFNISNDIVAMGLKRSGYKFLTPDDFNKKMLQIFKLNKNSDCNKVSFANNHVTLFGNLMDGSTSTLLQNQYELYNDTQNLFIIPNKGFITQMFLVKDLVKINGNSFSIQIPQFIIARNKFLFNDSKGDLVWLLFNDKEFLKRLVTNFGYDKDEKINKLVLEDLYKEYSSSNHNISEKLGEIFFTKDCQGKLHIQEGLLKYVNQNTNKDDDRFIYALGNYLDCLFKEDKDGIFDEDPSKKFTIEEKAKIVAYVANIESPAFYKYKPLNSKTAWKNAGTSLYNITGTHPEILKIIEKNNYYGLNPLKEVLESVQFEEGV